MTYRSARARARAGSRFGSPPIPEPTSSGRQLITEPADDRDDRTEPGEPTGRESNEPTGRESNEPTGRESNEPTGREQNPEGGSDEWREEWTEPGGDPTGTGSRTPPPPGTGQQTRCANIATIPGPAPALGRPGLLPRDHGAWKNIGCYSRGSKGWKPDILTLGDAHNCPIQRGRQSPNRPGNVSGDPAGYNTELFSDEDEVARVLGTLGYQGNDGEKLLRRFQRHWNRVTNRVATIPTVRESIPFVAVPVGTLRVDGQIGPNTLNALEVAIINQEASAELAWTSVIGMVGVSSGRTKLYNAAQGE